MEAIASTCGQLMPPVMGVGAFVMTELLAVPYAHIALAGLIPALAFYIALFIGADLYARRAGVGTLTRDEIGELPAVLPRIHLLTPPLVLIAALIAGYSTQRAAMFASVACFVVSFFRCEHWLSFGD